MSKGLFASVEENNHKDVLLKGKANLALKGHTKRIRAIAANPAETIFASAGDDGVVLLWDLNTLKVIQTLHEIANLIQFSPDGRFLAVSNGKDTIKIWAVGHWQSPLVSIGAHTTDIMLFSKDSRLIAAVVESTTLKLWLVATGEPLHSFIIRPNLKYRVGSFVAAETNREPFAYILFNGITPPIAVNGPVDFSKDGRFIASSVVDYTTGKYQIKIWNTMNGRELRCLSGHNESIRSIAFSPVAPLLASASWDGIIKIWSTETGEELATILHFERNDWVICTPDGRFDTGLGLDEIGRLGWAWPTDPLHPLPMRVFIRDYYEPGLLQKILAGESLKPVPDISKLNRAQPTATVLSVIADGKDTVRVTVQVRSTLSATQVDKTEQPLQSGVFNVMLLRDNRVVGQVWAGLRLSRTNTLGRGDPWFSRHLARSGSEARKLRLALCGLDLYGHTRRV